MVASVAVGALAFGFAPALASVLTDRAGEDEYATLLRILAVAIPVATVGEVLMGATRGLGSMRPTVLASQLGRQVGQLVTVGVVLSFGGSLSAVAVAWAVPYLATVVYPAVWLRSRLPRTGQPDLVGGDRYWRFTIPQAANSTAQSGLERFDVIALGFLIGSAAQGEYSVANRMAHVVVLGWYAINLGPDADLRPVVRGREGPRAAKGRADRQRMGGRPGRADPVDLRPLPGSRRPTVRSGVRGRKRCPDRPGRRLVGRPLVRAVGEPAPHVGSQLESLR